MSEVLHEEINSKNDIVREGIESPLIKEREDSQQMNHLILPVHQRLVQVLKI